MAMKKKLKMIMKDPEQYLIEKYYKLHVPKGFRIELFLAKKYKSFLEKARELKRTYRIADSSRFNEGRIFCVMTIIKYLAKIKNRSPKKEPQTVFCPCCEKRVIPKKLHKLDFGDIVLFLFTAGFWGFLLFVMSLFIRRCPTCNYSLRGFKPLSKEK